MRKKKRLIVILSICIYLLVLLIISAGVLVHVKGLLVEYEQSQPEVLVESQIRLLKTAAEKGELGDYLNLPDELKGLFVPGSSEYDSYSSLFTEGEISYRQAPSQTGRNGRSYYLLSGDRRLATMNMEGSGDRTELIVFQYVNWSVASIDPMVYTADLTLPEGLTVRMGDREIVGTAAKEGKIAYHAASLSEIRLTVSDRYGNEITPEKGKEPTIYGCEVELPKEFVVRMGDRIVEGSPSGKDDAIRYRISSLKEVAITVEDGYGHSVALTENADLKIRTFRANVPFDYTVQVGNKTLNASDYPITAYEEYGYFKEYYEKYFTDHPFDNAPGIVNYSFNCLVTDALTEDVKITSPKGEEIPFDYESGVVSVGRYDSPADPIPSDLSEKIDVKKFAETWALFLTRDLTGNNHGFSKVSTYFIKDSDLYKYAYKWATGSDIGFISSHTLDNPTFTNEKFTNYRTVGDNCFLCDVSLSQHMTLKTGAKHTEKLNMTVCFVYYDQTDDGKDNPKWYAVAFRDIVDSENA